jgi:hypothetical protein
MMMMTFWHPDGTPMSAQQFMEMLFHAARIFRERGRTLLPLGLSGLFTVASAQIIKKNFTGDVEHNQ